MAWGTAWITGASSGIGLKLASLLDGEVPHVAISARSANKLEKSARAGETLVPFPLDVTDARAVDACVRSIENTCGPIDLAVLNAGIMPIVDADDMDLEKIRAGLEVNYMGVVNCVGTLVPRMIERGSGHIAIMASASGYRGLPRAMAYGPTKAALINLTETLHGELQQHGIRVQLITPGFVDTPLTKNNTFSMPGIISVEEAARSLLDGLKSDTFEIIFPKGFLYMMKSLRRMPNALYFWIIRTFVLPRSRKVP